jgi:hypothetical protein
MQLLVWVLKEMEIRKVNDSGHQESLVVVCLAKKHQLTLGHFERLSNTRQGCDLEGSCRVGLLFVAHGF